MSLLTLVFEGGILIFATCNYVGISFVFTDKGEKGIKCHGY